ncbi:MAG: hypothetical protein U0169_18300 [Polyangiaceae bacterium]
MRSSLVHALFQPPAFSIHASNIFVPARWVPMNMRCSKRWANPERFAASMREPTLYETFTTAMGTVWSSWRITFMPFVRVVVVNGIATVSARAGRTFAAEVASVATDTATTGRKRTFRRDMARTEGNSGGSDTRIARPL